MPYKNFEKMNNERLFIGVYDDFDKENKEVV